LSETDSRARVMRTRDCAVPATDVRMCATISAEEMLFTEVYSKGMTIVVLLLSFVGFDWLSNNRGVTTRQRLRELAEPPSYRRIDRKSARLRGFRTTRVKMWG
jgi:hypothetical protein